MHFPYIHVRKLIRTPNYPIIGVTTVETTRWLINTLHQTTNMELRPGLSALVTGGASGIGRALVLALAQKGIFITVVDFSEENGKQAASLAEKEVSKFHGRLEFPSVQFIKCDVTKSSKWQRFLILWKTHSICSWNSYVWEFWFYD